MRRLSRVSKRGIILAQIFILKKPCFLFLSFFVMVSVLNSQPFSTRFEYLSNKDGLSQNHVFNINQDRDSFMWFSTMVGLCKYDGFQFTNYFYKEEDTTTISGSYIDKFFEDSKGRYWVGTLNGFNRFFRETGKFKRYYHSKENEKSLGSNRTKGIIEDSQGFLWIVHDRGIDRFNPETEHFEHFLHPEFAISRHSGDVFIDSKQRIWVIGTQGVFQVNHQSHRLDYVGKPNITTDIPLEGRRFFLDSQGSLWIGFNRCLTTFDPDTKKFAIFDTRGDAWDISQVLEYPKGTLVIGTHDNGLIIYSLTLQKVLNNFTYSPADPNGIGGSSVYSLFVDKEDNLWIGLFFGINRINPNKERFPLLKNEPGLNNLHNFSLLLYSDVNGGLWNNTMKGLFYRKTPFSPYESVLHPPHFYDGFNNVKPVCSDKNYFYFNVLNKGIFAYGFVDKKIKPVGESFGFDRELFLKLEVDPARSGSLLLATNNGLCVVDMNSNDTIWYRPKILIPSLDNNVVSRFALDGKRFIYFVNSGKLIRLDRDKNHMMLVKIPEKIRGHVYGVKKYGNQIWVGTTAGVYQIDPIQGTMKVVKNHNTGNNLTCIGLEVDVEGNAWSINDNVITKISADGEIKNQYLAPTGFVNGNAFSDENGRMYFGGSEGGIIFDPLHIFKDTSAPKIIFTGFEVANRRRVFDKEYEYVDTIYLKYEDKTFSLFYSALHFVNRNAITYRYKLDGFDQDWILAGSKRNVTYTNLPPGTFTFQVMATTEDGVPSKKPLRITIIIKPPFYLTWYFFLLVSLVAASLIYLYYSIRRKAMLAQREKKLAEQNANYKSMFMANMSHEIRTPMNAIVGLNQLLMDTPLTQKQMDYVKAINISCENMLWIINDILDQAKIESGKYQIVHKTFMLPQMLGQIETLFSARAEEKGLSFALHIDPDVPRYIIGDQVRLFQILTNLLGNAIKFTKEGTISLFVHNEENTEVNCKIQFRVKDTGIGIPKEKLEEIFESFSQLHEWEGIGNQGTGLGLSIVRQLTSLLKGTIHVESVHGNGSVFTLILPFEKAQNSDHINTRSQTVNRISGLHILLVEDAPLNQLVATELLKKHIEKLELTLASHGLEAVEKCEKQTFDIILMDVKMPVMNGLDATRRLREIGITTPVLGLTANAIPQQIDECLEAGMDDCTTKPIQIAELIEKIQKLVPNA